MKILNAGLRARVNRKFKNSQDLVAMVDVIGLVNCRHSISFAVFTTVAFDNYFNSL